MREYGQVQCSFWSDPEIHGLSDDGKLLAVYLLTGPHSNGIGCYRLPDGYISSDLGWSSQRVSKGFAELFAIGFSERCETTFFVLIPHYLRWNEIANGNVAKARVREFEGVSKKASIYRTLCESLKRFGNHWPNGFETLLERYAKQEPTQTLPRTRTDPEPEPIQPKTPSAQAMLARPARGKPAAEKPTAETWAAYAAGYRERYGIDPTRNAKVNGQLAQLVGRLGGEEAPQVAGWYPQHNGALYVRARHCTDLLLRDAEALRTEWATGRQVTHGDAALADRTQTTANVWGPLLDEAREAERLAALEVRHEH